MTWIRLALMLDFFVVAHKAARQILSKALQSLDRVKVLLVLKIFLKEDS